MPASQKCPSPSIRAAVFLISFYHNSLRHYMLPSCRFIPTCSEYATRAIQNQGIIRGSISTLKRLLRCHPFCSGGVDWIR